ncbi:MAG: diadenylate cyclase CdaA [Planctomycetota bacterium]
MLTSLTKLIQNYHWFEILVEMAVIWCVVYLIFRFLQGTRGAGVIKGVVVLLVVLTLLIRVAGSAGDVLGRLDFIYNRFLGLLAILLIVVFQPELRQAMIRLGHTRMFRLGRAPQTERVIEAVSDAVLFLSKNQFGALIAVEREVRLGGLSDVGVELDAKISARLLETIFWPNSPLHDLGVIVRDDRIVAASVQFPLIEEGAIMGTPGSRHRAAAGVSLESDCVVVIVSEETGAISIAERGQITFDISRDQIRDEIARRLAVTIEPPTVTDIEPPTTSETPSERNVA